MLKATRADFLHENLLKTLEISSVWLDDLEYQLGMGEKSIRLILSIIDKALHLSIKNRFCLEEGGIENRNNIFKIIAKNNFFSFGRGGGVHDQFCRNQAVDGKTKYNLF